MRQELSLPAAPAPAGLGALRSAGAAAVRGTGTRGCGLSRSCCCRATSQSKHGAPSPCPLPAASDLRAAHRTSLRLSHLGFCLQIPPQARISGGVCLRQAEPMCLKSPAPPQHPAGMGGRMWGMNPSSRNALRDTHGGGGSSSAAGVQAGASGPSPAPGWAGFGVPSMRGAAGRYSRALCSLQPPRQGIAESPTSFTFALSSPPPGML